MDLTEPHKDEIVLPIESLFDELALDTSLDLLLHPMHKIIYLPEHYVFINVAKFWHMVAINRACMLYLLAKIVAYDIAMHNKVLEKYFKWKQISQNNLNSLNRMIKKNTHAKAKLHQSQKKYIDI